MSVIIGFDQSIFEPDEVAKLRRVLATLCAEAGKGSTSEEATQYASQLIGVYRAGTKDESGLLRQGRSFI
ncbi:MAG: hypothetical protein QHC90_26595 [Shinella sp.]|nr:hypothetical protein [Shinella sp.]